MRETSLKIMALQEKRSQRCWMPGTKLAGIRCLKPRMKMPHRTRVRVSIGKWVVCPYMIGWSAEIQWKSIWDILRMRYLETSVYVNVCNCSLSFIRSKSWKNTKDREKINILSSLIRGIAFFSHPQGGVHQYWFHSNIHRPLSDCNWHLLSLSHFALTCDSICTGENKIVFWVNKLDGRQKFFL